MFPFGLPAPFCQDVGDVALLQIPHEAFHHAHPVGQHQGQPVAVAGFAVLETAVFGTSTPLGPEGGVDVPNTAVTSGRSLECKTSTLIGCC